MKNKKNKKEVTMKWQQTLENILCLLIIGICLYLDKSSWCMLLLLIPILNILSLFK